MAGYCDLLTLMLTRGAAQDMTSNTHNCDRRADDFAPVSLYFLTLHACIATVLLCFVASTQKNHKSQHHQGNSFFVSGCLIRSPKWLSLQHFTLLPPTRRRRSAMPESVQSMELPLSLELSEQSDTESPVSGVSQPMRHGIFFNMAREVGDLMALRMSVV